MGDCGLVLMVAVIFGGAVVTSTSEFIAKNLLRIVPL